MTDFVTLRHPKLPAEQTIRIHRKRVSARLAAGWVEVESKPDPQPETNKAANEEPESAKPATEDSEPTESAPKRRSRRNTEEQ